MFHAARYSWLPTVAPARGQLFRNLKNRDCIVSCLTNCCAILRTNLESGCCRLCASFVPSVSPWLLITGPTAHHKDTKNTKDTQRIRNKKVVCVKLKALHYFFDETISRST